MAKKSHTDDLRRTPKQNDDLSAAKGLVILPDTSKPLAKATHQVADRAHTSGLYPLQDNELRSIYALFAWVANEQKAAPETVQSMTEAQFGIDHVTKIKKRDYDDVIRFLVDLRIDEMKN